MSDPSVAILYARRDSVYKTMPECDVWDIDRDARTWPGGMPVVAHPPCRAWGRMSRFAKPRPDEKDLARHAVAMVRQWGGVLEHPEASGLWHDVPLPLPGWGIIDSHGGYSLSVDQHWWGHRARKSTWLYIVGCACADLPQLPLSLGAIMSTVKNMCRAERERTPPAFAAWLVELAKRCAR